MPTSRFIKNILFVSIILFLSSGLYLVHEHNQALSEKVACLVDEQQKLKKTVHSDTVQSQALAVTSTPGDNAKGFAWCDLKPTFANTVVQVFSQAAEFNWLQPWRPANRYQSSGSGFFINEHGEIITNAHVINEARVVTVKIPALGKRQFEVDVLGLTTDRDLALLKLKPGGYDQIKATLGKIPYLGLSNSDKAHRAEEVMALGYPLGQQSLKSTTGVISGWEHLGGNRLTQMDAAINPGSSGGPVLNRDGQVIGASVSGIMQAQNVGYFIPSNDVIQFINQLKELPDEPGKIKVLHRPYLGVSLCNSTQQLTSYLGNPHPGGLVVVDVFEGGPLHKAGVQPGDMLYSINGNRVDLYGEVFVPEIDEERISVIDYVGRLNIGEKIEMQIYRKGKKLTMHAILMPPDSTQWPLRKSRIAGIDFDPNDYEIIGGLCIMPLTRNHIALLQSVAPLLGKYIDIQHQREPALIVSDVLFGSLAFRDKVVGPGVLIDKVNDTTVRTLDELRSAIRKGLRTNYIKIETQEKFIMVFSLEEAVQEAARLAKEHRYKLSPFMHELQKAIAQRAP